MDFLLDALTDWLKEMLVGGIMSNLSGMFDSVNQQVGDIATQVGQSPQGWNGSIFSMIQNLSNSIMVPIAGVILAIVMTLELIQMITDRNNLHDVDTWMIFKWVFKSAAAILLVTNTWNLVMAVFDMAQSVVAQASGIIGSDASIDISSVMTDMESRLMDMDLGPLFGLWFQSLFIGITMWALYICIFIVIYGRMIEIYLVTSVAPIPMATMMGKEWGGMGQNYLRSLLALGFQAFLIIVCVAIYAVLVQNIATEEDIITAGPAGVLVPAVERLTGSPFVGQLSWTALVPPLLSLADEGALTRISGILLNQKPDPAIETALAEAAAQGIAAKAVTPFLLQRIYELTKGRSLDANIALVLNNARLAARIATAMARKA